MEENKKQQNTPEKNKKTLLHTYLSDMADVVRENKISVTKIALAEQKARERGDYYNRNVEKPKKKFIYVLSGIIILVLAVGISYFSIKKSNKISIPPKIVEESNSLISFDSKTTIDVTTATNKNDMVSFIKPEIKSDEIPQTIKEIILIQKNSEGSSEKINLSNLLSLLNVTAPGSLLRSFSDSYMLGTYATKSAYDRSHLFLIIKVNDYNQAYAGMLEWEKTMLSDLLNFFQINIGDTGSYLLEKPFKDIVIKNKDVRILYSNAGADILFYLFADKDTLIITDSKEAITEIIDRIIISQTKPL